MKRNQLGKAIMLSSILVLMVFLITACGSNWTFSGNNVTVSVAANDTVVPSGSIILTPSNPVDIDTIIDPQFD